MEETEQLKAKREEEEDPGGPLQAFNSDGDLNYWHRRTRRLPRTSSLPGPGSSVLTLPPET